MAKKPRKRKAKGEEGKRGRGYDDPYCPICGVHCQLDGPCKHLVSSWSFADEAGEWGGGPDCDILGEFEESVQELSDLAGSTDAPKDLLQKLFPKRLHVLLKDFRRKTVASCCDAHLVRLIEAHPKFVGSRWDQSDGPPSSTWTTYFAKSGFKCAWDVEEQLDKDVKAIRGAILRLNCGVSSMDGCLNCGQRCKDLTSQGLCDRCDDLATNATIAGQNCRAGLGYTVF
jgi:hypothetical protein